MKRYWLNKESIKEGKVYIDGEFFHHISVVCRNGLGSKFEILTGEQIAYFVKLIEVNKKSGVAEILEERKIAPLEKPYIRLVLSMPRFHKMDWIIEKSVELGVYALHPIVSDYSFVKKIDDSLDKKRKRWGKIIESATQQSGRGDLMKIEPIEGLDKTLVSFSNNINQKSGVRGLFSYEGESVLSLKQAVNDWKSDRAGVPKGVPKVVSDKQKTEEIWIFVGSEGGFSKSEVEKFSENGLEPITLGNQVLRVDTACLALISILRYEYGLMGEDNVY